VLCVLRRRVLVRCDVMWCDAVKLMTQLSTKLLLPFFSFISQHQNDEKDDDEDEDDDDAVNVLSSCVADALFPR